MASSIVKKPWALYLMALWSFLGLGSFLMSVIKVLFSDNQSVLQISTIVMIGSVIYLAHLLSIFNKKGLIVFAVLSITLAIFQIINIFRILAFDGMHPIIYLLLYYIIPSIILAWLALSKKYRKSSEQYTVHLKQESMHKAAMKAMRK